MERGQILRKGGRKGAAARRAGALMLAAIGGLAGAARADSYMNNGGTALNVPTSWLDVSVPAGAGTGVPGSGDVASWSAATALAGPTTFLLGADTSWGGMSQTDTTAGVTVDNLGSNLTLGASGVSVSGAGQHLTLAPNSVTLGASQVWNVGPSSVLTLSGTLVENGFPLTIAGGGDVVVPGVITGSSGVTVNGTGTLILSNANAYLGTTFISGGKLMLDFSASTAPAANILLPNTVMSLSGGRVVMNSSSVSESSQTLGSLVVSTGASSMDLLPGAGQSVNLTVSAAVTRTQGSANASVGGTLRFSTTGTFTLTLTANKGFLADSGGNAYATLGLADWAATDSSGHVIAATYVTSNPSASTNFDVTSGVNLATYSAGTLRFNSGSPVTITQSAIGSVGGILMTPNSGGATITGGSLRPFHTLTTGASLSIIQNSTAASLVIGAMVVNGTTNVPTSVVKSGAGTVVFSNAGNSYTGDTFINEGTLSISANGDLGLGTAAAPVIFSGGTLLSTSTMALNNAPGSGNRAVTLNVAGGTLSATSGNTLIVPGVISGTGGLSISGGGTVSLSGGSNNYSGGTSVVGAALLVSNTAGSATGTGPVTLGSGGVLSGTGNIGGTIVAGAGAHVISPGGAGSVGTLTAGGLFTNGDTTLAIDLCTPPGGSDLLTVNGNVVLGGGTLVANSQAASGIGLLGYYRVISYSGSLSGSAASVVMPAMTGNLAYTLDVAHDAGFIDVHVGYMGDVNDDGAVDLNDLNVVLNHLGTMTGSWAAGNFDGAETVDLNDLNAVLNRLGTSVSGSGPAAKVAQSAPVPEAGCMGLLTFGASGLMVRRGRRKTG